MNDLAEPVAFIMLVTEEQMGLGIPIKSKSFRIGRVADNDLCLADDQSASRYHCVIRVSENNLMLEDLKSSNGTYLNGVRIEGEVPLTLPSLLSVGRNRLALIAPDGDLQGLATIIDHTYSNRGSIVVPSTAFFRERESAFLLIDLVGSTKMLQQNEVHLAKIVATMGRILERELKTEPEPFLQCTGDGYFASFSSAERAMEVALNLSPTLATYFSPAIQLCVVLHWGSSYLTGEGSRTGKDVYAVFALERLRHQDEAIGEPLRSLKTHTLCLMTGAFFSRLAPQHQGDAKLLGLYELKGLEAATQVFLWEG